MQSPALNLNFPVPTPGEVPGGDLVICVVLASLSISANQILLTLEQEMANCRQQQQRAKVKDLTYRLGSFQ